MLVSGLFGLGSGIRFIGLVLRRPKGFKVSIVVVVTISNIDISLLRISSVSLKFLLAPIFSSKSVTFKETFPSS